MSFEMMDGSFLDLTAGGGGGGPGTGNVHTGDVPPPASLGKLHDMYFENHSSMVDGPETLIYDSIVLKAIDYNNENWKLYSQNIVWNALTVTNNNPIKKVTMSWDTNNGDECDYTFFTDGTLVDSTAINMNKIKLVANGVDYIFPVGNGFPAADEFVLEADMVQSPAPWLAFEAMLNAMPDDTCAMFDIKLSVYASKKIVTKVFKMYQKEGNGWVDKTPILCNGENEMFASYTPVNDMNVATMKNLSNTPAAPMTDGEYKLKVAAGVATWVTV